MPLFPLSPRHWRFAQNTTIDQAAWAMPMRFFLAFFMGILCYNMRMDKYRSLLLEWCDALVEAQIKDKKDKDFGGFRCGACDLTHGRADNAVYPFVCAYDLTGEERYLAAAERLLVFRKRLTHFSGAVQNDFTSAWRGITAFSAINLMKTLLYFGEKLPRGLKKKIERCAKRSARWVHRNMIVGFPAYVNYYCASALVNALYAELYHDETYATSARTLLSYCLGLFTENGLLAGEGKPHDARSPKGCLPIDIGYIAEESMPCLIHAAALLGEKEASARLAECAKKQLDFFLPDGGWDNTFGVRNNKWTYYGSRTSDGCIGAFCELAKGEPLFAEAAERTYEILRRCTHGGLLHGGMQYAENGEKPCVHHTFCHACSLADALHFGISEPDPRLALPCDEVAIGFRFYPEINTYKIHTGRYLATLTGYDFITHAFSNGAAHAGGGTLSLLYKQGAGAMIAGSVYEYKRSEKNNMQIPSGKKRHASLLLRAEYEKEGVKYATCLDPAPEISVFTEGEGVTAQVRARFFSAETRTAEKEDLFAEFRYRFTPKGVTLTVGKLSESIRLILPLVTGELITKSLFAKEPVFFLTGGFSADECAFSLGEDVTLTIV